MRKYIKISLIILFLPLIVIIGFLNVLSISLSIMLFALTGDIYKAKYCIKELSDLWK